MPAAFYARQIGQWLGLDLPITNMLHHYLVTEKVAEFSNLEKELPVVRDDSQVSGYIRMEQKSGLIAFTKKLTPLPCGMTAHRGTANGNYLNPTMSGLRRGWKKPWRGCRYYIRPASSALFTAPLPTRRTATC